MDKRVSVIIVEDQRFARMYMEMYIGTSSRYEIAASLPFAEDLPQYLETHTADLIILDILMAHGIDGLTAAAKIKQKHPQIKIILCTSMAQTDWMDKAKGSAWRAFGIKNIPRFRFWRSWTGQWTANPSI